MNGERSDFYFVKTSIIIPTGVLYSVIFCGILLRTPEVSQTQRRTAINSAIGNSLTVIPILVYQVLLGN